MDIGEEKRTIEVEPIKTPVPARTPRRVPEPERQPVTPIQPDREPVKA